MIGSEERRRLMERQARDESSPLGAVLKCAAGLLVLVVVAAGSWALLGAGSATTAATVAQPAPEAEASMAQGKRAFDERRESARQGRPPPASNAASTRLAVE